MNLIQEDLARAHMDARLSEARELRRSYQLNRAERLTRGPTARRSRPACCSPVRCDHVTRRGASSARRLPRGVAGHYALLMEVCDLCGRTPPDDPDTCR